MSELRNTMRNFGREMGEIRRAEAEKRKNEFLHTRVSDELKEKIKTEANKLNMPISILIRNILEAYFEHSDIGYTNNKPTRHIVRFPNADKITGWQEFFPIKQVSCTSCGRHLKKGARAYRGVGEKGEFLDIHCNVCVSEF